MDQLERDLELAEATLRDIKRMQLNRAEAGWITNRRATIYAVEAEIRRLQAALRADNLVHQMADTSSKWVG